VCAGDGEKDMIDTDKTPCNCCRELIAKGAPVCYHCGRNQKRLMRWLAPTLQGIGLLVSAALLMLSWGQFSEATKQRKSADEAFRLANVAKIEAEQARDETRKTVEHLRTNIKLLLEMEHLTPAIVLESYDPVKVGRVRQKLEEFAVPDEKERKNWLKSLKQEK
jgi:hypothetical protein